MPVLESLDAASLAAVVRTYRDGLLAHRERLNRLNVYPVPDGDTGTNMSLTLESVCKGLPEDGADLETVCKAVSHGSLMGARGNSGVILSQILRGIVDAIKQAGGCDGPTFATALATAREAAYGAVMRPVEGTILTVVRGAAEAATAAAQAGASDLVALVETARAAADEALASTPDLLPALKQAGVVDAGGAGLVLLLDSLLTVLDGRAMPESEIGPEPDTSSLDGLAEAAHHDSVSDLRYEVMYFLEAPDETIPAFKQVWAGIGDSIVVVGGDGIWNCHIHTDDIGASIEAAMDCGRPRNIRVTDLLEQVQEEKWVREAAANAEEEAEAEPVPTAVVAVGTGEGIGRIFRSLGVQRLVAGGQSMNPSTEQLLDAVMAARADEVVILPNNKNIIPVAKQVDGLTDKTVRVVPTTSVAEGFAALLEYDPEASADDNRASMEAAAGRVIAAEVTQAVRDSDSPAGPIAEGDWLGLTRSGIQVVQQSLSDAATALLEKLVTDDHEIVTLIEGDGASPAVTREITEWLAENRPNVSSEVHHGGQPLYPYLLSIE